MTMIATLRSLFWLLAASVLFFALVPGPLGEIIPSDFERHYLAFLALPAFAVFAWPSVSVPALWAGFVVFGGLIEILQKVMNVGRAAEWHDLVNDMVATTMALVVANLLIRMMRGADRTA